LRNQQNRVYTSISPWPLTRVLDITIKGIRWLCWKACDAFVSIAFTVFTFLAFLGRIFLVSSGLMIIERSLSLLFRDCLAPVSSVIWSPVYFY